MAQLSAENIPSRPHLLVLSSTDKDSLLDACEALCDDLAEEDVELQAKAKELSQSSNSNAHCAFVVTRDGDVSSEDFVMESQSLCPARVCLLFTGQGAQWPQMGKDLLAMFPIASKLIDELDEALKQVVNAPSWSIAEELVAPRSIDQYKQPEVAQTLTTALQLAIVAVLQHWGIEFKDVIGHSSGEIAAACAAGLISPKEAIITAYYCGWAASHSPEQHQLGMGMLAAGTSPEVIEELLRQQVAEQTTIACYNGPRAVTLSGPVSQLEKLRAVLRDQGRQTSLLSTPVAYHNSSLMQEIGQLYESKLQHVFSTQRQKCDVSMMSTITTESIVNAASAEYWKNNIVSPVRFHETLTKVLAGVDAPTHVIEIGPAGSLAGAVLDIKAETGGKAAKVAYYKTMNRGKSSNMPMFHVAGNLYVAGCKIDLALVNS
ncbi:hypothetical protein CDD81_2028 [Ophiocordyceps australis]|uniref:Malonyl-CoA:ACP transacylase (MAT) domain-containing protein n=1 Tax=Ophiocordyceps australis TaxID=1399860 RepID=A0A2C5YDA1_9HYPO|nr:hypothetical protein CDD81_2028 [Ophiocordyceps australis]